MRKKWLWFFFSLVLLLAVSVPAQLRAAPEDLNIGDTRFETVDLDNEQAPGYPKVVNLTDQGQVLIDDFLSTYSTGIWAGSNGWTVNIGENKPVENRQENPTPDFGILFNSFGYGGGSALTGTVNNYGFIKAHTAIWVGANSNVTNYGNGSGYGGIIRAEAYGDDDDDDDNATAILIGSGGTVTNDGGTITARGSGTAYGIREYDDNSYVTVNNNSLYYNPEGYGGSPQALYGEISAYSTSGYGGDDDTIAISLGYGGTVNNMGYVDLTEELATLQGGTISANGINARAIVIGSDGRVNNGKVEWDNVNEEYYLIPGGEISATGKYGNTIAIEMGDRSQVYNYDAVTAYGGGMTGGQYDYVAGVKLGASSRLDNGSELLSEADNQNAEISARGGNWVAGIWAAGPGSVVNNYGGSSGIVPDAGIQELDSDDDTEGGIHATGNDYVAGIAFGWINTDVVVDDDDDDTDDDTKPTAAYSGQVNNYGNISADGDDYVAGVVVGASSGSGTSVYNGEGALIHADGEDKVVGVYITELDTQSSGSEPQTNPGNKVTNWGTIEAEGGELVAGVAYAGTDLDATDIYTIPVNVENHGTIRAAGYETVVGVGGGGYSGISVVDNYQGAEINAVAGYGGYAAGVAIIEGSGTITNNGAIRAESAVTPAGETFAGIMMTGNDRARNIIHNGLANDEALISAAGGQGVMGIYMSYGGYADNAGTIQASGTSGVYGILMDGYGSYGGGYGAGYGAGGTVYNYGGGSITATADYFVFGVYNDGYGGYVNNAGTIQANGDFTYGVFLGHEGHLDNSGTIEAGSGLDSSGVYIDGVADYVGNTASGSISSSDYGVFVTGHVPLVIIQDQIDTSTIVNDGEIMAHGDERWIKPLDYDDDDDDDGFYGWIGGIGISTGGNANITNSGTITGNSGMAIQLRDAGENYVTLQHGTKLYGRIAEDEIMPEVQSQIPGTEGRLPGVVMGYGGYGGNDTLELYNNNPLPDLSSSHLIMDEESDGFGHIDWDSGDVDVLWAQQIQGIDDLVKTGYGAWAITKDWYDVDLMEYSNPNGEDIDSPELVLRDSLRIEEGMLAIQPRIQVGSEGIVPQDDDDDEFYQAGGTILGLVVAPDSDLGGALSKKTSGFINVLGEAYLDYEEDMTEPESAPAEFDDQCPNLLVIPEAPPGSGKYAKGSAYAFLVANDIYGDEYHNDGNVWSTSPFLSPMAFLMENNDGTTTTEQNERPVLDYEGNPVLNDLDEPLYYTYNEEKDAYWLGIVRDFALPAETDNQKAVGEAIDRLYDDPNTDEETMNWLNVILAGVTEEEGLEVLNETSGLVYTAIPVATLAGINQYFSTLTDRMGGFITGDKGNLGMGTMMGPMFAMNAEPTMNDAGKQLLSSPAIPAAQADNTKWGFWTQVFGAMGEDDGDDIASQYDYDTMGITLGFDKKISSRALVGVSFGYAFTNADMDKINEEVDVNSYQASVYGVYNPDPWYVTGILSYAFSNYESTRKLDLLGLKAEGDYDGNAFAGYVEAGYRLDITKTFDIIPMASFQVSYVDTDSFKEKGADSANLEVEDADFTSLLSTLGVRIRKDFIAASGTRFIPEFRARWAHEFSNDDYESNANFIGSPASSFKVQGDDVESDGALLGAGLTVVMKQNLSFYVNYDANLSGDFTEHAGTLGLRYRW